MADPFASRFDLTLGTFHPYTDDTDDYDPTDALAAYSLPKSDPADLIFTSPSPASQDQSVAWLDPSVFAPSPDLGTLAPPPPGAVKLTTSDGDPFFAPAGTDFNDVYRAGQTIRGKPLNDQLDAVGRALGHGGTYDFQRQPGKPFNGNYRSASNFAVGAYMNGAGFSWPETAALGGLYATLHGRPDVIPDDEPWWQSGYDAAASGQLPTKAGP